MRLELGWPICQQNVPFLKTKPAQWDKSPMMGAEKNSLLMISFYSDGLALLVCTWVGKPCWLKKVCVEYLSVVESYHTACPVEGESVALIHAQKGCMCALSICALTYDLVRVSPPKAAIVYAH